VERGNLCFLDRKSGHRPQGIPHFPVSPSPAFTFRLQKSYFINEQPPLPRFDLPIPYSLPEGHGLNPTHDSRLTTHGLQPLPLFSPFSCPDTLGELRGWPLSNRFPTTHCWRIKKSPTQQRAEDFTFILAPFPRQVFWLGFLAPSRLPGFPVAPGRRSPSQRRVRAGFTPDFPILRTRRHHGKCLSSFFLILA